LRMGRRGMRRKNQKAEAEGSKKTHD